MLSQLLILAFLRLGLISDCTDSMISLFLLHSWLFNHNCSHVYRLSATVYLLCNKKCTSQYLKKSSPQIGECVSLPVITPYNPVSGQWSHCLDFLTFIFCEFGHRRLILVILVSGVIWSRDSVCVPRTQCEWITFCTCQSDKNIPGSQAGAAAYYHSSRE